MEIKVGQVYVVTPTWKYGAREEATYGDGSRYFVDVVHNFKYSNFEVTPQDDAEVEELYNAVQYGNDLSSDEFEFFVLTDSMEGVEEEFVFHPAWEDGTDRAQNLEDDYEDWRELEGNRESYLESLGYDFASITMYIDGGINIMPVTQEEMNEV